MSSNHSTVSRYWALTIALFITILCLLTSPLFPSPGLSLFTPIRPLSIPIDYFTAHNLNSFTTAMGDNPFGSCPQNPPLNTNKRTEFGRLGCTVYGYPSAGGILIKEADVVDMRFLRLDRFTAAQRSANIIEEDAFCNRMRMVGAVWWADEQEWINVQLGLRGRTELEERRLVFGWPSNGEGVWVLRYDSERALPRDFGRISLAMDMDERCRVMRDYGARFYENAGTVDELQGSL